MYPVNPSYPSAYPPGIAPVYPGTYQPMQPVYPSPVYPPGVAPVMPVYPPGQQPGYYSYGQKYI